MGSVRVVGDTAHTVFYSAGQEAIVEHPYGNETAGTTIRLCPGATLWGTLEEAGLDSRHIAAGSFPIRSTLRSMRTEASHRRLIRAVTSATPETVRVQELTSRLLIDTIADATEGGDRPRVARGSSAARVVSRVQEFISWAYPQALTLHAIAREAGCSAWHLSRVFAGATGISVHRFLTSVRLRHAIELLESGETSLTRTAFACGFSSHSHFTSAFRREFGVTPSRWRVHPSCAEDHRER